MGREARLTVTDKASWYFLHAKIKPTIKKGALNDAVCGEKLLGIIALYSKAFECELAGFFISKHHYVLVVKFHKFKVLPQNVLLKKVTMLYNGKQTPYIYWSQKDWDDFNTRVFDVGEFMRSVQMTFSRWFNINFKSKGNKLWAERYKSTILTNDSIVLDAILYVEAGPLREKVGTDLSSYKYSSLNLRNNGAKWLAPLSRLGQDKLHYQQMLNHRAKLPLNTKLVSAKETKNGYEAGCYLKRQRYFIDGLILGSEKEVQAWINKFRKEGRYLRRTRPTKLAVGTQYSIREQRSHYQEYR